MMERKEFLKGALSSLSLLSVSGCLTAKLYEPRTYDETALSFLVTEDGSHLVVLGDGSCCLSSQFRGEWQQCRNGRLYSLAFGSSIR